MHNPAFNSKNVRTACAKLKWNTRVTGNAKASAAIERKARKERAPCTILQFASNGDIINALVV